MIERYCPIYDAEFIENEWLEDKCCDSPSSDCYFRCWERPDIPCVNCKMQDECPEFNDR